MSGDLPTPSSSPDGHPRRLWRRGGYSPGIITSCDIDRNRQEFLRSVENFPLNWSEAPGIPRNLPPLVVWRIRLQFCLQYEFILPVAAGGWNPAVIPGVGDLVSSV